VTGVVAWRSKWAAGKAARATPIFIRAARLLTGSFAGHSPKTTAGIPRDTVPRRHADPISATALHVMLPAAGSRLPAAEIRSTYLIIVP
jgi:hypothetical protein